MRRLPWIVGLVLVAALLRLPGLDQGLWFDEVVTLEEYARAAPSEIVTRFTSNNNHPLYSLLAHASIRTFGEEAWSLRLPAFLFGVASLPLLLLLGLRVTDPLEAWTATALATVSYHHVWFSQNARGYTALLAFTLLSTWLLLRGLERRRHSDFVAYALSAALGAYTHLTMGFVIASQGVVAAARWLFPGRGPRLPWTALALGFGLTALLCVLSYLPFLEEARRFFVETSSESGEVATLGWALRELARHFDVGIGGAGILGVGAAVGLLGTWSYLRKRPAFVGVSLLPALLVTGTALAMGRPIFPRFYFFLMGFALLLGTRGGFELAERGGALLGLARGRARAIGAAVAGLGVAASLATVPAAYGPKQDFEGALRFAEEREQGGARIAVLGLAGFPFREHFGKRWPELSSLEELRALESDGRPLFLVYTFPVYIEAQAPRLMERIRERCGPGRVFPGTVGGGDVVVCRMRPAEP